MSTKYDVIVVGAGVSGLLSALSLSKEGKSVLILEKEDYVGGVCRSYKVQGYTVDTGPGDPPGIKRSQEVRQHGLVGVPPGSF